MIMYTHCHNQAANNVHHKLATKCGLSERQPTPYYKYEPQSVLENFNYKVYYDRSIMTNRSIQNKTILIDAANPNTHKLHNTVTDKFRGIWTWKKSL
jgi:hypothetical protein